LHFYFAFENVQSNQNFNNLVHDMLVGGRLIVAS